MRNYIYNLLAIPSITITLLKALWYQKRIIQNTIAIDIEEIKKVNDGSLTKEDFKRIAEYGLNVHLIFGVGFCMLRGKSMTLKENYALTYLGASASLFDDFFDKKNTSENHIKYLMDNPSESNAENNHEKLIIRLCLKALENCADKNLIRDIAYKVYEVQIISKKQKSQFLDVEEIKDLTFKKGAAGAIFYRSAWGNFEDNAEEKVIQKLGNLLQLADDIFDVYIDFKNEVQTLVTTETKINNLRNLYKSLMDELFTLVYKTNFSIKNKKKFLRFISIILCRGFVCLDYLEKNEVRTNSIFSIKDYNRNDLICDMEKPKNIFKWLDYYLKCKVTLPKVAEK